jgi:hypothetical protein
MALATIYTAGALLTAAMIYNANKTSGTPWLYTVAAAVLWPIGWTDCAPLETGRFQQWLRLHGKC